MSKFDKKFKELMESLNKKITINDVKSLLKDIMTSNPSDNEMIFQVSGDQYDDRVEYLNEIIDELSSKDNTIDNIKIIINNTDANALYNWIIKTDDPIYTFERLSDTDPGWVNFE